MQQETEQLDEADHALTKENCVKIEVHEQRMVELQNTINQKSEYIQELEANFNHEKKNAADILSQITKKNTEQFELIQTTNLESEFELKLKIDELETKLTTITNQYNKKLQANKKYFMDEIHIQQRGFQTKLAEQEKLHEEKRIRQKQINDEELTLTKLELNIHTTELGNTISKLTRELDLANKTADENILSIRTNLTNKFQNMIAEEDMAHKREIVRLQTENEQLNRSKIELELNNKNLSASLKNIPSSKKLRRDIELISADLEFERTEKDKLMQEYIPIDEYNKIKHDYNNLAIQLKETNGKNLEHKTEFAALNERFRILQSSYNDIQSANKNLKLFNTNNAIDRQKNATKYKQLYNEKLANETTKLKEQLSNQLVNQRKEILSSHEIELSNIKVQTELMVKNYEDRIKKLEEDIEKLNEQNSVTNTTIMNMKSKMITLDKENIDQIDLLKQKYDDAVSINERFKIKCNELSGELNNKNIELSKTIAKLHEREKESRHDKEKLIDFELKYTKLENEISDKELVIDELSSKNDELKIISTEKLDQELKTIRNMFVGKINNQNDVIKDLQEQLDMQRSS